MPLRLMQIILPATVSKNELPALLEEKEVVTGWTSDYPDSKTVLHLLVPAEECEAIIDKFEQRFSSTSGYGIVLLPVEAFLPRPKTEAQGNGNNAKTGEGEEADSAPGRVSREELYAEINEGIVISHTFLAMTFLSAVVAAIGLMRDDLAVIIGAMVIAPLLTPNVALALSTTLGDTDLLRRSLATIAVGFGMSVLLALLIGLIFKIDPTIPALASRTRIGIGDIMLALASGAAGTLAFTSGVSGALIGVMVAVALMPPLVVFGMLLGSGHFASAAGALFLVTANVICVNLAGVGTFRIQGVRPKTWWEAQRAKRSARFAVFCWGFLLMILIAIILLGRTDL